MPRPALPILVLLLLLGSSASARCEEPAPADVAADALSPEVIAEARSLLDRMREAYAAEDLDALVALHDQSRKGFEQYRMELEVLLAGSNYFELSFEDLEIRPWSAGVAEAGALLTLRFRHMRLADDRATRRRVVLGFDRGPEGRLRISSVRNVPDPQLPRDNPVRPVHYAVRARLVPEEGRLEVEGELTVRNVSAGPVSTFWLLLDGFAEGVELELPGAPEPRIRLWTGSQIVAELSLAEPLPAGARSVVRFRHRIVRTHTDRAVRIAPDATWFLEAAPWIPIVHYPSDVQEPLFDYDLVVTAPEGQEVVTAGELASVRPVEGGREFHWFSVDPTGEILLLAGPLERSERPGKPFRFTLYTPAGGRFPGAEASLGWFRRGYDFLAARLGAPPRTEITVVALPRRGLYGGAHLWVVDAEWLRRGAKPDAGFLRFVGHQAGHAWFVQGIRATGPGDAFLREGLSELAGALLLRDFWGEAAWQGRIEEAQTVYGDLAGNDQALGVLTGGLPLHQDLARQKGVFVLHSLIFRMGEEAFLAGLSDFVQSHARQPVAVYDLQRALEARWEGAAPFFADWIFARRLADPAVEDLQSEPPSAGETEWLARLRIRNRGEGRVVVPFLVWAEAGSAAGEMALGPGEEGIAEVRTPGKPLRAELDPQRVVVQLNRGNDYWPHPPTFKRPGLGPLRADPDAVEGPRPLR